MLLVTGASLSFRCFGQSPLPGEGLRSGPDLLRHAQDPCEGGKGLSEQPALLSKAAAGPGLLEGRTGDRAGYYKFAHKSIFEFLLARKAISDFQFRKKIFLKSFFGYDMLEFFLNELDRENFKKLLYRKRNKLNFVNSAAFHFLQLSYLKATGIKLEKCSFKKCDLSKIDWSDSTFVDLSFCDSKMKEISLYRSKFVKVIFENVNMSEANLMGVKLEKTKLGGMRQGTAQL